MIAHRSAAALTPEELYGDPERVLWPLVGAGLQGALIFAPLVAAVLAAGSSYAVEQAIIAPWRPAAPSDAEVEEACGKAEKYFQVTAPPERAGPRAANIRVLDLLSYSAPRGRGGRRAAGNWRSWAFVERRGPPLGLAPRSGLK